MSEFSMPESAPVDLQKIDQSIAKLTPRQRAILAWMAHGSPNHEIAEHLSFSRKLIETECSRIFSILGVENRTAAAVFYALWENANTYNHRGNSLFTYR
ncbi:MAG: helix-turn-helix transcriptional regulator [Verrucomicrobiota bacterium]